MTSRSNDFRLFLRKRKEKSGDMRARTSSAKIHCVRKSTRRIPTELLFHGIFKFKWVSRIVWQRRRQRRQRALLIDSLCDDGVIVYSVQITNSSDEQLDIKSVYLMSNRCQTVRQVFIFGSVIAREDTRRDKGSSIFFVALSTLAVDRCCPFVMSRAALNDDGTNDSVIKVDKKIRKLYTRTHSMSTNYKHSERSTIYARAIKLWSTITLPHCTIMSWCTLYIFKPQCSYYSCEQRRWPGINRTNLCKQNTCTRA